MLPGVIAIAISDGIHDSKLAPRGISSYSSSFGGRKLYPLEVEVEFGKYADCIQGRNCFRLLLLPELSVDAAVVVVVVVVVGMLLPRNPPKNLTIPSGSCWSCDGPSAPAPTPAASRDRAAPAAACAGVAVSNSESKELLDVRRPSTLQHCWPLDENHAEDHARQR